MFKLNKIENKFPLLWALVPLELMANNKEFNYPFLIAGWHLALIIALILRLYGKKKSGKLISWQEYVYIFYFYILVPDILNAWLVSHFHLYLFLIIFIAFLLLINPEKLKKRFSK